MQKHNKIKVAVGEGVKERITYGPPIWIKAMKAFQKGVRAGELLKEAMILCRKNSLEFERSVNELILRCNFHNQKQKPVIKLKSKRHLNKIFHAKAK